MGTTISISGSGKADVTVYGRGTVIAGNGNDSIHITGLGKIVIGSGQDTLNLDQGGVIREHGASGHDTINIGAGNATIYEQGHATVTGAFGSVTMSGGVLEIHQNGSGSGSQSGSGHSGSGAGASGSSGHDTSSGSASHSLVDHLAHQHGAFHFVNNFVSGQTQLHLEGHSLSYLLAHHEISTHGHNTIIGIDGGKTTIELHGMKASDLNGHKN